MTVSCTAGSVGALDIGDISVIICAYTEERWHDLIGAVTSVQQQSVQPLDIIVVIDHNPTLFASTCEQFPGVAVIENSQQPGLSGARNSGIAIARGEIIAFLDDDAQADPEWIAGLLAGYADPTVIGVGGAITPVWPKGRPRWFPNEFDWVVGCTYRGFPQASSTVRNLIGCNMSFRRKIFTYIGGFRAGIGRHGTRPLGCEETELCIRAHQQWPDRSFLYVPEAAVHHRVTDNRAQWKYFRKRCYSEGISKAHVSRFVGTDDGLASERTYVLQVLPQGILHGLKDTLCDLDRMGVVRAGAIVAGLALTTAGYLKSTIFEQLSNATTIPKEYTVQKVKS